MTGRQFKRIRRSLFFSQRELAKLLCVSCPAICRIERGNLKVSPRTERLLRVVLRASNSGFSFGYHDLASLATFEAMLDCREGKNA